MRDEERSRRGNTPGDRRCRKEHAHTHKGRPKTQRGSDATSTRRSTDRSHLHRQLVKSCPHTQAGREGSAGMTNSCNVHTISLSLFHAHTQHVLHTIQANFNHTIQHSASQYTTPYTNPPTTHPPTKNQPNSHTENAWKSTNQATNLHTLNCTLLRQQEKTDRDCRHARS